MTIWFFILIAILMPNSVFADTKNHYTVLCYHDIRKDLTDTLDSDQFAVGTDNLIAQFSWLKSQGYHVISVDDLVLAEKGIKPLPEKAIMLTFDDGYASVYHLLFPLLKAFQFPAVVAVVGSWLEPGKGAMVKYGDRELKPRNAFLSWQQIKEMSDSGLVEIASHSYDLHHGILGNPQGNTQPAAVTRTYDATHNRYASDYSYRQRIYQDLKRNSALIARYIGKAPRVMVWPYGEYSYETTDIAGKAGMPFTMTLRDGSNSLADKREIRRVLIEANPKLKDFVHTLEHINETEPVRAVRVSMQNLFDPDPEKANANLGRLLDQINALKINTVYLQAVADRDGDGKADTAYFPNRHLPVAGDFFNRVEWQLETRAQLNVYAWMPFRSFALPNNEPVSETKIIEIYEDLAKYTQIDGLLFYDGEALQNDNAADSQWLTRITQKVKYYRPEIKTALALPPKVDGDKRLSLAHCCDYFLFELPLSTDTDDWQHVFQSRLNTAHPGKHDVFELVISKNEQQNPAVWQQLPEAFFQLMQQKAIQLSFFPFSGDQEQTDFKILQSTISLRQNPILP